MLRLVPAHPVDTLWDTLLPAEVRRLPADLAQLDILLEEPVLLTAFQRHWDQAAQQVGRPTIPMATYLRLMVVKHRTGWGYETLIQEVSDSLHLRRFCLLALHQRVPNESTVRKLTRRLGSELVTDLIRQLIATARRERRFRARAMRCDSTVVAADIRYPTDSGLCSDAVQRLAREARRVRTALPTVVSPVRERRRAMGRRLQELSRSLGRRLGKSQQTVRRLTEECADLVRKSVKEARTLLSRAKRRRRGAGVSSEARRQVLARLARTIGLAERIVEQIRRRFAGEPIADRLVSLADSDARPVRRGKLAHPTEFGYVVQLTELTPHTRRGARGLLLPPKLLPGSPPENSLLPVTVDELQTLELAPREAAFDRGFHYEATRQALSPTDTQVFIAGTTSACPARTRRRLRRYRVGMEGRIAHIKRQYGAGRCRLRGTEGARIWQGWAVLAYDLDTVAIMPHRGKTA